MPSEHEAAYWLWTDKEDGDVANVFACEDHLTEVLRGVLKVSYQGRIGLARHTGTPCEVHVA
jgi:hypothetical protein